MDHSKLELLRQVRIEKPCDADWDEMTGDERSRHCAKCDLSVNNVAEMSAAEAEELFAKGGHVCARLTVDEAAARLGVSRDSLRVRLDRMKTSLPFGTYKHERRWYVHPLDAEELRERVATKA